MNVFDILILAGVAAVLVFAVVRIISNRKKGKICGGNCECCALKCSEQDTAKKK